ncbi:hypothetical protein N9F62_01210, partial [bacterium]|nr:hypothetical protein [bacterium]
VIGYSKTGDLAVASMYLLVRISNLLSFKIQLIGLQWCVCGLPSALGETYDLQDGPRLKYRRLPGVDEVGYTSA